MSDAFAARLFHELNVLFPLCDLEGNEWEEHPKYCLTGEGNSVATKGASTVYSPWHDWDSTLVTNRVMDSGIHRISHLSRLHRAYFGDDVHDAGLPGSTTWCGLLPLTKF